MDYKQGDDMFAGAVVFTIIIVVLLAMSGAFEGNGGASRGDLYSECVEMGGRNCRDLLR